MDAIKEKKSRENRKVDGHKDRKCHQYAESRPRNKNLKTTTKVSKQSNHSLCVSGNEASDNSYVDRKFSTHHSGDCVDSLKEHKQPKNAGESVLENTSIIESIDNNLENIRCLDKSSQCEMRDNLLDEKKLVTKLDTLTSDTTYLNKSVQYRDSEMIPETGNSIQTKYENNPDTSNIPLSSGNMVIHHSKVTQTNNYENLSLCTESDFTYQEYLTKPADLLEQSVLPTYTTSISNIPMIPYQQPYIVPIVAPPDTCNYITRYPDTYFQQNINPVQYTNPEYVQVYNGEFYAQTPYIDYQQPFVAPVSPYCNTEPIQFVEQKFFNSYFYPNYEVSNSASYMRPQSVPTPTIIASPPYAAPYANVPQAHIQQCTSQGQYPQNTVLGPVKPLETVVPPHPIRQEGNMPKYPYIYVSETGLITALLKNDVSVEMTLDRTIRLVNHNCRLVVATNGRGSASCLYHPGVRVCQDGTNTDVEIYGERKAHMTTDFIHFSLRDKVYRFNYDDIEELDNPENGFVDISRDQSVDLLFNSENIEKDTVYFCYEATREAHCQYFPYGGFSLRINGVKITQTDLGDVIVTSWPKYLKIATGNTYLHVETHFSDISVDKNWNVRVSRGAHVLRATPTDFILSNGRLCAGFVNENEFTVYNASQGDKEAREKERRWRPNCPKGINSTSRTVGKRTPREGVQGCPTVYDDETSITEST